MKVLNIFLGIILIFFTSSCLAKVSSPMMVMVNQSGNYIRNFNSSWNEYKFGGITEMTPGNVSGQNFILNNKSDLYGPVHIEWENAEGKKIVKEFNFEEKDLPNFHNIPNPNKKFGRTTFDNVYFFLTQEDFKMIVDPNGMGSGEIKKEQKMANKFSDDYVKICPKQYGCDLRKK